MNTEDTMRAVMAASEKEAAVLHAAYGVLNAATVPLLKSSVLIAKYIADNPSKVYHAEFREMSDLLAEIYPAVRLLVNFNTKHKQGEIK